MTNAQKSKYIAEGFYDDCSALLTEFVELETVEFSEFAALWRKRYFSLIFMGRPDHTETSEFVNEIFRVTSQFIFSSSFYQRVGVLYILYALFRNQISEPSIKIRIEMSHWNVIKSLRDDAITKKCKALHYVIDYLIDHAFIYVANQTLKGPLTGNMPQTPKYNETLCNLKTSFNTDIMNYSANNNLAILRDLQMQYLAEKKNIHESLRVNLSYSQEIYTDAMKELQELITPKNNKEEVKEDLGDRRAKLKVESFMRKSKNRFGFISDDEVEIEDEIPPDYETPSKKIVRTRKPRRAPKEERKVGRPRVKPKKEPPPEPKSDDEFDISHLLEQQQDFYLPPISNENRKLRTKRDPYYQASPKRDESDSDTDISE